MKKLTFSEIMVRVVLTGCWITLFVGILFLSRVKFFDEPNSITILSWWDSVDREYARKFEEETGIKVYMSSYSTNEELFVKLRATGGRGYDLIIPSDYAVKKLVGENLLKKIDTSKLTFYKQLNPLLLGHHFDPHNEYSIPYEWEIYLLGVNTNLLNRSEWAKSSAWDLAFSPQKFGKNYRLNMTNDPVEAILFAATYLFGPVNSLTDEQQEQVKELLINQKQFVEAYASVRSDYFLGTGNAVVALAQSSEIWRAVKDYSYVDFVIPQQTFISIENCAIPTGSTKESLVYKFLNFLYSKESYTYHYNKQLFCPARLDVIDELNTSDRQKNIMRSSIEAFKSYSFIKDIVSEQAKHSLWIAVKS